MATPPTYQMMTLSHLSLSIKETCPRSVGLNERPLSKASTNLLHFQMLLIHWVQAAGLLVCGFLSDDLRRPRSEARSSHDYVPLEDF